MEEELDYHYDAEEEGEAAAETAVCVGTFLYDMSLDNSAALGKKSVDT